MQYQAVVLPWPPLSLAIRTFLGSSNEVWMSARSVLSLAGGLSLASSAAALLDGLCPGVLLGLRRVPAPRG